MADTYWDHPARRETKRLIDLGDAGAILDELQNRETEWDDARAALDNLVRAANYTNAGLNEALAAAEAERAAARTDAEKLRAELTEIQQHDETTGGVLYDVIRRTLTGDLDEHQAVRQIERRLIQPLIAQRREALATAARAAARRRRSATTDQGGA